MSRRSYDDITDNRVTHRGNSSSRVLLAVILLSILICAIAVLCWVKILETQQVIKPTVNLPSTANSDVPETQPTIEAPVLATELTAKEPEVVEVETPMVSLSIEEGLSNLEGRTSANSEVLNLLSSNFISSSDLSGEVVEESVEMKKPTIAQNLSISQQSLFSKNLVKYQEYNIQEGDSLEAIANMFGISLPTLLSVNQIKSTNSLFIGSTLQIPDRDGSLYSVAEGDTLLSITQQFGLGISAKTLGDINGISDDNLVVGQKLFIPSETRDSSGTLTVEEVFAFVMPCEGKVVAMYNQRVPDPLTNGAVVLDGILIQAEAGTPIIASEAGTVVDKGFNDNGSGFVKVLHNNGYTTYYNYLADVCVETADKVSKGQLLATFGSDTTNLLTPTLFFKIEQDGVALDPYSFF